LEHGGSRRLLASIRPVVSMIRRAAPRDAVVVLVLQTVSGALTAFGLLATLDVLEELLAARPTGERLLAAAPALALVAAAFAMRGLCDAGVAVANARIVPATRRVAEEGVFAAAVRVELSAFDDPDFYDRLHRARDRGVLYLERASQCLVQLIGALLALLAASGSVAVLHPALLPVLLLGVVPEGWAVLRAARLEYASMARIVALTRRTTMISELTTKREAAAEIRACQAEEFVLADYRAAGDALRDQEILVGVAQARTKAYGRALAGLGIAATFAALGLLLNLGWVPLAVAGTAVLAIRSATGALNTLVLAANELFEQSLYIADYQRFLDDAAARSPAGSPTRGAKPAPDRPRRIALERVSFAYTGADRPAIRDVSLTVDAGQTIALVGENGSGKTTVAKLIAGLYRPTAGRITWDGADMAGLDPVSVADRVVMVLQDPVHWPHTARQNVTVGRHDRVDPDGVALREAALVSRADEVVAILPKGWETLLSRYFRGGRDLSGGQWQRLAIARGLYRDAPLLIWDEPTAPLDARAEYAVYESLRALAGGRTVVLITHRLASVRHADRIYLLHGGELAEQGSHDELMAAGGRYAELYTLQAKLNGYVHEDDVGLDPAGAGAARVADPAR
jgi:ABC-type multidrug transport system fused ATPase/permease subunit